MKLKAIKECSQCGGDMELSEIDRIVKCPYCDIRHYLSQEIGHYQLPEKMSNGELYLLPYLRFKGSLFTCSEQTISQKIIDNTILGLKNNIFPLNLGYRSQAMKLYFANPKDNATYLQLDKSTKDLLRKPEYLASFSNHKSIHSKFIGETISIIYQPLRIIDNIIYDSVTTDKLAKIPSGKDILGPYKLNKPDWQRHLIATICPNCGADLSGEKESVILLCHNCEKAWEAPGQSFKEVAYQIVASPDKEIFYLPFWQMKTKTTGIKLDSYRDFIKITNIPRQIKSNWANMKMSFYCPAFKIRPKIFLRVASQVTTGQHDFHTIDSLPKQYGNVTLPLKEAQESLTLILAGATIAKRNIFPLLPKISMTASESNLIFLPFRDNGYEYQNDRMKVTINKQVLKLGKNL